ncbi:phage holin [Enterococcus dispar]|uniref:Holin n=1 Tax=Enterococcus dispar ATCC 51266 TaxID=1139219 RepID=S1N6Z4_9ENTE|nr:phage holin [Enterococcus dispar]EOT42739.1 hypothetical protein OMK_01100 [Enterococcus dispar ATCC 51266]EOW84810.1 hypothetical protein I569_00099 [Enterococcus dispar ATCC 51266]OJG38445.1 hypothetical protein RV01_GL002500 [Enterococcus dispar]
MPKFKLTDEQYAVIKWAVGLVMPGLGTLFAVIGKTLNWPFTEDVLTIWTAFTAFLGMILGVSSYQYNKEGK